MSTWMKIAILLMINTVLAQQFSNPSCAENVLVNGLPKNSTLFLFMVGFGQKNVEDVFYVVKQTTCWLPKSDQIKAAALKQGQQVIQTEDSFDIVRANIKGEAEDIAKLVKDRKTIGFRTCSNFQSDLTFIKSQEASTLQNFTKVFLIAHQSTYDDQCDYYAKFNGTGLASSKFTFSMIRFDNKTSNDYPILTVPPDQIKIGDSLASPELRKSSGNFINKELLGVSEPSAASSSTSTDTTIIIILVVVIVILVVIIVVGVGLFLFCKLKKKNKNPKKDKKGSKEKKIEVAPKHPTKSTLDCSISGVTESGGK
ncbi:unnamed protein product [Caenorhabditis angaria]|uniref:Peptidase S72 domain-containing protein n=1 Tax=Caenorhabditis angaria TaxID=860376 RepID=A0A9P1IF35_9PELO|nr:unnamed protein product [Caenorhabditis angaria]